MHIKYRRELPELMRYHSLPMVAAEIGVAEGFHAADLLRNGIEKLYLVDAWQSLNQKGDGGSPQQWHDKNYKDAVERVKEFGDKAIFLKGLSWAMAEFVPDDSLGLIYLDGDHSYTGVFRDLLSWFPKVAPGGIIAGHDFLNPAYGVRLAVNDFVSQSDRMVTKIYTISEDNDEDAGFYFFKTM